MKRSMTIVCLMLISILMYAQDGINIGGELKMRNRINLEPEGSKPGFEFYECELFIDGDLSDYSSFYIEYKGYLLLLYFGLEEKYNNSEIGIFNNLVNKYLEEDRIESENKLDVLLNLDIKDDFLMYKYVVENGKVVSIESTKKYLFNFER